MFAYDDKGRTTLYGYSLWYNDEMQQWVDDVFNAALGDQDA